MKKLKFLIRSIKGSTLKTLFEVRRKVKEKSHKKFILFDIIYCGIKYQTAFYDYLEFEFYNLNREQRKTYLTNGKNNEIIKRFNNKEYWHILDDKGTFNDYFKEYLNRDYLKPNSSKKEFEKFIKGKDKVVCKPVDGVGGKGIKIRETDYPNLYSKYKDYLMEEYIVQHEDLSKVYSGSVNSLRLFTFFDGENSYLLQTIIKFGNNGFVDNFSSGGMYAFVDDEGKVITPAIDQMDNEYIVHPESKEKILGFKVPNFDKACEVVLNASKKINEVKYIGWDVAITKDKACIIEGNSYPGVFQIKPKYSKDKTGILPKYEEIMKIKF